MGRERDGVARRDEEAVLLIVFFVVVGRLSDRPGRKR